MSQPTHYQTIETTGTAGFEDRGSRFIGYAFPVKSVADFKKLITDIKKEHAKATHHCFAYRIGLEGNEYRASDDGEPSGSAGRPILGQIDSKGLTDILVIVVRYYGVTMLGIPGLINAYKTTASLTLQVTPAVRKAVEKNYTLQFDYTKMNEVMTILKRFGCTIHSQEMQLFCSFEVGVAVESQQDFYKQMKEIQGLTLDVLR